MCYWTRVPYSAGVTAAATPPQPLLIRQRMNYSSLSEIVHPRQSFGVVFSALTKPASNCGPYATLVIRLHISITLMHTHTPTCTYNRERGHLGSPRRPCVEVVAAAL